MKKGEMFFVFVIFLIFFASYIISAANSSGNISISSSSTSAETSSKVDKGYECLTKKVQDKCSNSLEDNIFTLLAIKKCKSEVDSNSKNDECWPKDNCKIKQTAQAILALNKAGDNTDKAEKWLLSKNSTPADLIWYLQIESTNSTTCKIKYSGSENTIFIDETKKINSGAGSCLTLSEGGYWLKISQSCYDKEFEISCNEGFLTTLLYKKEKSSTIYVLEKTNSGSAEGATKEKVNSLCFGQGSCDYEGSLWATLVLNYLDYDISPFIPYLITMSDENKKFIPESFLYGLTGYNDFRNDLLLKQKSGKYWDESGDKFYDTALALYPFQNNVPLEKTNSINWLLETQDSDGCWQSGNIKSTAFILYSIWPKQISSGGGSEEPDCEDTGHYCMSELSCSGKILSGYRCSGIYKCCDTKKVLDTCRELGGEICNSNQNCENGVIGESSDTDRGEVCCIKGICKEVQVSTDCELAGGTCRSTCNSDEKSSSDSCGKSSGECCIKKVESPKSYLWIWILLILIILVLIGIFFRDKLRAFWFRIKSGGDSKQPSGEMPRRPPGTPPTGPPFQRMIPRKIFPPVPQRRPNVKRPGEIDEVLKKLKEISK